MTKEEIQKELTQSLKAGESLKRMVLGTLMSAIKSAELNKRTKLVKSTSDLNELEKQSVLTPEELLGVLAGEVKKRKESIAQFKRGGREDLAAKEQDEIDILAKYLPPPMEREAVEEAVEKAISKMGATDQKDRGRVIGVVMAELKGKVDGVMVSELVQKKLSSL